MDAFCALLHIVHKSKQFIIIWSNQNISLPCWKIFFCHWWQLILEFSTRSRIWTLLTTFARSWFYCLYGRQKCARDCLNLQRMKSHFSFYRAYLRCATSVIQIIIHNYAHAILALISMLVGLLKAFFLSISISCFYVRVLISQFCYVLPFFPSLYTHPNFVTKKTTYTFFWGKYKIFRT